MHHRAPRYTETGILEVRNRTNKHVSRCRVIGREIAVTCEADWRESHLRERFADRRVSGKTPVHHCLVVWLPMRREPLKQGDQD